jgi:hypothetical protein
MNDFEKTKEEILNTYNQSKFKTWIKLLPENKLCFDEYIKKDYFHLVADVIIDNEVFTSGKKEGKKKRNTLIQFLPKISKELFNRKSEWLYLFTIGKQIVKIGGTRIGLKGRIASYLCGHHIKERKKSGDCSKTNGFIYNTFDFYLQMGYKIQMYGYELPKTEIVVKIFEKETKIIAQTYHAFESKFLEDYKTQYKKYPILNDNCDPEYKE